MPTSAFTDIPIRFASSSSTFSTSDSNLNDRVIEVERASSLSTLMYVNTKKIRRLNGALVCYSILLCSDLQYSVMLPLVMYTWRLNQFRTYRLQHELQTCIGTGRGLLFMQ